MSMSAGLGIDLHPASISLNNNSPRVHTNRVDVDRQVDFCAYHIRGTNGRGGLLGTDNGSHPTLRSISAMKGLLLAEMGDSMVELDVCSGGSGFREGPRIALEAVTPGGSSRQGQGIRVSQIEPEQAALSRHGTLLSVGATPERNAAELKSILGSSNARLKPGAAILSVPGHEIQPGEQTTLEQAKARARVEVDIVLDINTCVQGGYIQGYVKVRVRKRSKKEHPVMISGGKIRVIGFECISNGHHRYTFYQCSASLSTVTANSNMIYGSQPDEEGFADAREGVHSLRFSMPLPLSTDHGVPKGILRPQFGVAVRYIAMVSVKVKDSESGKRSIAHFYRNCEIWPRLNPSVILATAPKPLQMVASKSLFMGGTGQAKLTASLHRLHWIAGQQCCVNVNVANYTKKFIKSLTLTLLRTTTIFKPDPRSEALRLTDSIDPDACQTSTIQKQMAESILEMGQCGAPGHASAKGWWTGIGPGEHLAFSHFILIPPDAVSITRARLLEVEYTIRVTISAGTLRTADVQVTLPVRIVSFLSIDPPPSFPLGTQEDNGDFGTLDITKTYIAARSQPHQHSRPVITGLFDSCNSRPRILEPLVEAEDESLGYEDKGEDQDQDSQDEPLGADYSERDSEYDNDYSTDIDDDYVDQGYEPDSSPSTNSAALGNLWMYQDDTDEVVQHAIASARINTEYGENAVRFADLYYASVQESLDATSLGASTQEQGQKQKQNTEGLKSEELCNGPVSRTRKSGCSPQQLWQQDVREQVELQSGSPNETLLRPRRPRGPSSFALRVQGKLEAIVAIQPTTDTSITTTSPDSDNCTGSPLSNSDKDEYREPHTENTSRFTISANERRNSDNEPRDKLFCRATGEGNITGGMREPEYEGAYSGAPPILAARIPEPQPNTGSRLLPRPPGRPGKELAEADSTGGTHSITGTAVFTATTGMAASVTATESVGTTATLPSRPPLVPIIYTYVPPCNIAGTRAPVVYRDPNHGQHRNQSQSCGSGGSASSVKDKIRELEERARAAEM